jgi:transcriptional regulator with XRE-family HTH domain
MKAEEYRELREKTGLTQAKCAEFLGVSRETIARRETGGVISVEAALAIKAVAQPGLEVMPKLIFGKLLGELYRIQNKLEIATSGATDRIFGLLRGIEECIDEELDNLSLISNEKISAIREILDEIDSDEERREGFKGYYDIRSAIEARGITRYESIQIIKYLKISNQFVELIGKMNSNDSPMECRHFERHFDEK